MKRSLPIVILVFVHSSLEEGAQQVLDIFHDRLLVAHCRAGCELVYKAQPLGADIGQCWTVCHLMSSAPPVWAKICESKGSSVCGAGCQTACSLYKVSELEIVETSEKAEVSEGGGLVRLTSTIEAGDGAVVNILVARDGDGAWWELVQTPKLEMGSMVAMAEAWVVRVTAGGEVSIIDVKERKHWELFLEYIKWESGVFQVEVYWTEDKTRQKMTVSWSLGTVRGVLVTTDSRVRLPVPPGARVTIQVKDEGTGAVSDSLTLDIPDACETETDAGQPGSGSLLVMLIFVMILIFLAVTIGLVISLYRRTLRLCSSQSLCSVRVSSQSLSTEKNKSILSFDTFITRNKISVPESVPTIRN